MKTASAKMSSTNNTYLIHTKSIMMVQCNSLKVKFVKVISLNSVGAPFFIMSNSQEIRVISKNIMTGSPKCNS